MKASRRTAYGAAAPAGKPSADDPGPIRSEQRAEQVLEIIRQSNGAMLKGNPAEGLTLARKAVRLAERNGDSLLLINALLACHRSALMLEQRSEEVRCLERVVSLIPSLESPDLRSKILQRISSIYRQRGSPEIALELLDAALALSGVEDPLVTAKAFDLRGGVLLDFRRYDEAFEAEQAALELRRVSGDAEALAMSYASIGSLHGILENYVAAEPYCREAYRLGRAAANPIVRSHAMESLGATLLGLGKHQEAIAIYRELLKELTSRANFGAYGRVLHNIGVLYMKQGNLPKALAWLERSLKIGRKLGSPILLQAAWGEIGQVHQRLGDFSSAFTAYSNALKIVEEEEIGKDGLYLHQYLSEIHSLVGEYRESLGHFREAAGRRESILAVRAVVSEAVRRRSEIVDERERRELHAELDHVRKEAESKTKELNTVLLRLGRRDKALKSLMRIVEPVSRPASDETRALARKIVSEISSALDDHVECRMFEEQFERTHHEFIRRLRARFPGLTPTEIRVCVLLRLDMSTKQIGEALFASDLTIKTHRANIRRKMGLEQADNLGAFLMGL